MIIVMINIENYHSFRGYSVQYKKNIYQYRRGFLRAFNMDLFTFNQKATNTYTITGLPIVRKDI